RDQPVPPPGSAPNRLGRLVCSLRNRLPDGLNFFPLRINLLPLLIEGALHCCLPSRSRTYQQLTDSEPDEHAKTHQEGHHQNDQTKGVHTPLLEGDLARPMFPSLVSQASHRYPCLEGSPHPRLASHNNLVFALAGAGVLLLELDLGSAPARPNHSGAAVI